MCHSILYQNWMTEIVVSIPQALRRSNAHQHVCSIVISSYVTFSFITPEFGGCRFPHLTSSTVGAMCHFILYQNWMAEIVVSIPQALRRSNAHQHVRSIVISSFVTFSFITPEFGGCGFPHLTSSTVGAMCHSILYQNTYKNGHTMIPQLSFWFARCSHG